MKPWRLPGLHSFGGSEFQGDLDSLTLIRVSSLLRNNRTSRRLTDKLLSSITYTKGRTTYWSGDRSLLDVPEVCAFQVGVSSD